MIKITQGDILKADTQALVNTVNTKGIMGKGIALQFKKAFPENFQFYKKACDRNEVKPGKMLVFNRHSFTNPQYIINFPTKTHWKAKSQYKYIEDGLAALIQEIQRYRIRSLAIPPLGSGLGGLDWKRVRTMITSALGGISDIDVLLYEPKGSPKPEDMVIQTKIPKMTHGRAALLELMDIYAVPGYDYRLSLLEIQKLMYFLQVSGVKLQLKYTKGTYGPYADNLRHVLHHMEGHFITGFGDGQNSPDVPIQIKEEKAIKAAKKVLQEYSDTREKIDRVRSLIEGFETPYGMELLASVHWVCLKELDDINDIEQLVSQIHQWNKRKESLLKPNHIKVAWRHLYNNKWLDQN